MKFLKLSTLLLSLTLFACNSTTEPEPKSLADDEEVAETELTSENTVEAEEELADDGGRSTLVQALVSEESPESVELLQGDLENVLLHYRRVDEPLAEEGELQTFMDFLYFEGGQLTVGYSDFDSSTDLPVLGSSDFDEYMEEYTVVQTELADDQFVIETDSETFTFNRDGNELIDEQGNPFEVYQLDISDYLTEQ